MAEMLSIRNAQVLERIRAVQFDAEIIVSRLLDGETDTLLTYALKVAYQLDEVADLLTKSEN